MAKPEIVLAYITTKDKREARSIGKKLVEKRVAACVNILDGMESHYWWEGKIESANEAVLIAKTSVDKQKALLAAVKSLHSYSVPCVLFLPVSSGNKDYFRWLHENL